MPLNTLVVLAIAIIVIMAIMLIQQDFLGKLQDFVMPRVNSGVSG